jgi:deazaflavin-dependent oxidoreductase (nitroreductase family)
MTERRYLRPTAGDALFNRLPYALARLGISVYGTRILAVRGRRSGAWRSAVVNLLEHEGARYLVSPRGETQWVRNLRAAGCGELRLGRRREAFAAREIADAEKPPVLRAYLRLWRFEVKRFFPGLDADPSDADLLRVARDYPGFRLSKAS